MILPTIRASLSRSDAQRLVHLLGSGSPGMGYVSLVEAPRDERTSLQTPSQPRTVLCWQDPPVPGPPYQDEAPLRPTDTVLRIRLY